ncbi:MAG: hypothetical protein ACTSRQ_16620, partial [Candidatus Thorarchaeota archaeon]
ENKPCKINQSSSDFNERNPEYPNLKLSKEKHFIAFDIDQVNNMGIILQSPENRKKEKCPQKQVLWMLLLVV